MRLDDAQATTKLISRVSKDLQKLFGIDGPPLPPLPKRLRLEITLRSPRGSARGSASVTFALGKCKKSTIATRFVLHAAMLLI